MSNRVLDMLNKHRTRGKPNGKPNEIIYDPGTYPTQDLALVEECNAVATWREFNTNPDTKAKPKWRKKNHPDYRPGKVKVYTKQEIAQYMKERGDE